MATDMLTVPDGIASSSTAPTRALDSEELSELNDQITAQLAQRGWHAETDKDYEELNDLTHTLAAYQVQI